MKICFYFFWQNCNLILMLKFKILNFASMKRTEIVLQFGKRFFFFKAP